jgi:hypothetical protein
MRVQITNAWASYRDSTKSTDRSSRSRSATTIAVVGDYEDFALATSVLKRFQVTQLFERGLPARGVSRVLAVHEVLSVG